jgi:hypothetical protein
MSSACSGTSNVSLAKAGKLYASWQAWDYHSKRMHGELSKGYPTVIQHQRKRLDKQAAMMGIQQVRENC